MLPTKFQANWPFIQEKKQKIDFQFAALTAILDFQSE